MNQIVQDRILILDFGSQYTQLIARRIREIGVYCELIHWNADESFIRSFQPTGIILSGGPESVTAQDSPRAPSIVFDLNVPVLGICYGLQTMIVQQGGTVGRGDHHGEFGSAYIEIADEQAITKHLSKRQEVWMSHGDQVQTLPEGFYSLAKTDYCPHAMVAHVYKPWYGIQFHPEVTHTQEGMQLLRNFVIDICHCDCLWKPESIIEKSCQAIRKQVGQDRVILGLSGGVDSSVTALLLQKAIGSQLTCIFIDNGLLRLGEAEQVKQMFAERFGLQILFVDARESFLSALKGVSDPEEKRKVIGRVFVDVFEQQAKTLSNVKWLAQGTIYPDIIESAGAKHGQAHVIKSHHNVGGLPENMDLGLVEPLRDLFKDEVRQVGLTLGLPKDLLMRHPFPGPGLGVRVLGEIDAEYCDLLRQADAIFIDELEKADLYHQVAQAFVVFLPVKSVGVVGDGRCYDWVIALRAVETIDFMTARWANLPYDFLSRVSDRILNEIRGISRVVYDISGKPPATIEWE